MSISTFTGARQFLFSCGGPSLAHYMEVQSNGYFGNNHIQTILCKEKTIYNVGMTINGSSNTVLSTNGTSSTITTYQSATYTPITVLTLDNSYKGQYTRCHYYELLKNGTIVAKLYPVRRNSDSANGMYDIINNVFYGNVSTGSALLGGKEIPKYLYGKIENPEYHNLPSEYTELRYL
jgi:hypothetical protein